MEGELWLTGVCTSGLAFVLCLLSLFEGEYKIAAGWAAVWLAAGIGVNLPDAIANMPAIHLPGWIEQVVKFVVIAALCRVSAQIALLLIALVVLRRRKPSTRTGQVTAPAPREMAIQQPAERIDKTFRRAEFFEF